MKFFITFMMLMVTLAAGALGADTPPSKKRIAVVVVHEGPLTAFDPSDALIAKLMEENPSVSFLTVPHSLVNLQNFEQVRDGNLSVLKKFIADKNVDEVLVGKLVYSLRDSRVVPGDFICEMTFQFRIISKEGDITMQSIVEHRSRRFSTGSTVSMTIAEVAKKLKFF